MKQRKCVIRKIFASFLTVAMITALAPAEVIPVSVLAAQESDVPSLLADFTFENEASVLTGGNAKADVKGSYELRESKNAKNGKALYLNGDASNYLAITKADGGSLLAGCEEITVSFDAKTERSSTSWIFYAAPDANTQQGEHEHYIGAFYNNGNLKAERYHNNGSRPAALQYTTGERWRHIDLVFSRDAVTVYQDGVKKASEKSAYALPDILGNDGIFYIGRANWGDGEGFQGLIDNFRVYDGILSDAEIEKEYLNGIPEEEIFGEKGYSITVDPKNEGVEISQELIGLFFEDINSAADGGLNPEMVKNNSFENYFCVQSIEDPGRGNQYSWKLHWSSDQDDRFVVKQDPEEYMNANNTNYAEITGNMTLLNGGFAPMYSPNSAAMAVEEGQEYDFSIWTKAQETYSGKIKVQLVNEAGEALSEEIEVQPVCDGKWQKVEALIVGTKTQKGKIKLTIAGAADTDKLYIDMVSLSSRNTYGYGNPNYSCGKGLRRDLVEKLIALNPSFIRFPGGCIIEGEAGRDSYYNWEWSVGPLEERRAIANRWAGDNGSYTSTYSYMQSFGLGYHEMLTLCEDMGAEPFPILSAGVFCQFTNGDKAPAASGEELVKFAQHATHLVDYCWGNAESTDAVQREWASKRVANGHAEPFDLNYIGIGNENWREKYLNNFEFIKDYVEDYVAEHYPGRKITIISSSGPAAEDGSYRFAWDWFHEKDAGEVLVDEHYYQSKEFMLNKDDRYDYYTRLSDGGSNVFVGEYATHLGSRNNNLESAICDAAYMTGFERNGDIVRHASYAPLFEKIGGANWQQNMIHFDEYDSYGTPNYYVQKMYADNYGKQVVNTVLEKEGANYTQNTGSPVIGTWSTAGYATRVKVTREDGKVLLDDDFTSNTAGWEALPGSDGTFTIADGKLTFSQGNGMNCVWLPQTVNNPEWHDYKVETTVVKTGGAEGFLVGAGAKDADNLYWYNIGGWNNSMTIVEKKNSDAGTMVLGNEFTHGFTPVVNNEEMHVTFNYGVGDKLEAGYTSASADMSHDFSGNFRPYQNDIYQVATKDEQYLYLKLVNHDEHEKEITINYPGVQAEEAEIICLSGDPDAVNGIGKEEVVPKTTAAALENGRLKYGIPGMSFSVIKVAYGDAKVDKSELVQALKDKVEEEKRTEYTPESWSVYKAALARAGAVCENSKAEQKDVDKILKIFTDAKAGLKLVGEEPGPDPGPDPGPEPDPGPNPPTPVKLPYVDVAEDDWFYDGVYYNYFAETMTGKDETHFAPLENLARAQFAVIIHRMQNKPEMKYTAKFPDVAEGIWYTDAILWAADKEIVNGYSDTGLFGPADNINREQMAVMMYRYADSMGYDVSEKADIDKFEDAASVNKFAEDAMKWAVGNGIINGKYEGTKIDPQGNALRAECALIIQRFMDKYVQEEM